ncbi:MAG: response regulator transcription factor [Bacteroidia bacterium]
MTMKILMIDDEFEYAELTQEYLEAKGASVCYTPYPEKALELLHAEGFDICLLDVKMPRKDGFTLAEEIKQLDENMPLVFLTGQSQKEHKIKGLQLGADDYITKPYSLEELYLRLTAIMRRYKISQPKSTEKNHLLQIGTYTFNAQSRELQHETNNIRLSAIEAKLLELLIKNKNEVLKRDFALQNIWGSDDYYKTKSMNVYVTKLRQYLKADANLEILNVHGEGYKLVVGG